MSGVSLSRSVQGCAFAVCAVCAVCMACAACSSSSKPPAGVGDAAAGDGDAASGVDAAALGREVELYGRIDASDPNAPRFDRPGVYIEAGFVGTSVAVNLDGPANTYFDAYVDGVKLAAQADVGDSDATLALSAGPRDYLLSSTLSDGPHTVRLVKRNETMWAPVTLGGFRFDGGQARPAPARPSLKIEFIGDSYTVGYGNASPSKTAPGTQDESGRDCTGAQLAAFTNTDAAYGPLAARMLGAQYQVNAFSGLGMVRHYAGNRDFLRFQDYYARTLQSQAGSQWDPATWTPDVIVLFLGINDFSTALGAADVGVFTDRDDLARQYRAAYRDFLAMLRTQHPGVSIVLVSSNVGSANELRANVQTIFAAETADGHTDLAVYDFPNITGYGCAWHPDLATHAARAAELAAVIARLATP